MRHLLMLDPTDMSRILLNPDLLAITEFRTIWNNDKSKDKLTAFKELTFIYFMSDFNSPYSKFSEENKQEICSRDIMGDSNYRIPSIIAAAIAKYTELSDTPSMRLYRMSEKSKDRLATLLEATINKEDLDVKDSQTIISLNLGIGSIIESSNKLFELVLKESSENKKLKKSISKSLFEDGD